MIRSVLGPAGMEWKKELVEMGGLIGNFYSSLADRTSAKADSLRHTLHFAETLSNSRKERETKKEERKKKRKKERRKKAEEGRKKERRKERRNKGRKEGIMEGRKE